MKMYWLKTIALIIGLSLLFLIILVAIGLYHGLHNPPPPDHFILVIKNQTDEFLSIYLHYDILPFEEGKPIEPYQEKEVPVGGSSSQVAVKNAKGEIVFLQYITGQQVMDSGVMIGKAHAYIMVISDNWTGSDNKTMPKPSNPPASPLQ